MENRETSHTEEDVLAFLICQNDGLGDAEFMNGFAMNRTMIYSFSLKRRRMYSHETKEPRTTEGRTNQCS
jgi:hypothetical protein